MKAISLMSMFKIFVQDVRIKEGCKHLLVAKSNNGGLAFYVLICLISVLQYLLFHGPANLHDLSHYIVAGISMVRDHAELIYPYSSMNPEGGQTAYGFFQENGRLIELVKAYPARAYSAIFGGYFQLTGDASFALAHVVSMTALTTANIVLYLIGRQFFLGWRLVWFLAAVAFSPLLQAALYPGSDSIGYLVSVLLLWACLCSRLTPLAIGILLGAAIHFRAQLVALVVVAPILLLGVRDYRQKILSMGSLVGGCVAIYLGVGQAFDLVVARVREGGGEGFGFYLSHFRGSLSDSGTFSALFDRFVRNVVSLSGVEFLYVFFFLGCLCLFFYRAGLQKRLVLSAFVIVSVPLVLYSVDRFSDPHARYYIGAIPYLVLAWFLLMSDREVFSDRVRVDGVAALTVLFVLAGWYRLYGLPLGNAFNPVVAQSRWSFLDFEAASRVLSESFSDDDLIITNHALPSGLASLRNFIPKPTYAEFKAGDNREIDGIVFVYAGDPINGFFEPKDWMSGDTLPREIRDDRGSSFEMVANLSSVLRRADGSPESEARFVVYKNVDGSRAKSYDQSGARVFRTEIYPELTVSRTKASRFEDSQAWEGKIAYADANGGPVVVGPGPSSRNVLRQGFSVTPGERLRLSAVASSWKSDSSRGRLQVNWLNADGTFRGAEIAVFSADRLEKSYKRTVVVPDGVTSAVLYVTPHGKNDALKFSAFDVLGGVK